MYIYICMYIYIHIYIFIYLQPYMELFMPYDDVEVRIPMYAAVYVVLCCSVSCSAQRQRQTQGALDALQCQLVPTSEHLNHSSKSASTTKRERTKERHSRAPRRANLRSPRHTCSAPPKPTNSLCSILRASILFAALSSPDILRPTLSPPPPSGISATANCTILQKLLSATAVDAMSEVLC